MNLYSWLQLILYIAVLLVLAKPLGSYVARAYQGEADRVIPEYEKERMRFLDEETFSLRHKVGGLLVRLGPESVTEVRSDYDPHLEDGVAEAELTATR